MTARDAAVGWGAVVFLLMTMWAWGTTPPSYEVDKNPFNPADNPYDSEPGPNQFLPEPPGTCGMMVDADGDGLTKYDEPNCYVLLDTNADGTCDTRVFRFWFNDDGTDTLNGPMAQTHFDYHRVACSGWSPVGV